MPSRSPKTDLKAALRALLAMTLIAGSLVYAQDKPAEKAQEKAPTSSIKIGDRVFSKSHDEYGDGKVSRVYPDKGEALVNWESHRASVVPLTELESLTKEDKAAAKARGADAYLIFAEVGVNSRVSVGDLEDAVKVILKKSPDSAVDLVVGVPADPVDCVSCEHDGLAKTYTVIEFQRNTEKVRSDIWASIGKASRAEGALPADKLTFKDALVRFSKRYDDRNRIALFVTGGDSVVQDGEVRTDHSWHVTTPLKLNTSAQDEATAQEIAAFANQQHIHINTLVTSTDADIKVHYDPTGKCKLYLTHVKVMASSPTLAQLSARTGGIYAVIDLDSKDGSNGSSSVKHNGTPGEVDKVVTELMNGKGDKVEASGIELLEDGHHQKSSLANQVGSLADWVDQVVVHMGDEKAHDSHNYSVDQTEGTKKPQ